MDDTPPLNRERPTLPGEDGPLEMRYGGAAVTDDEALGVARRLARELAKRGRPLSAMAAVDELPAPDANRVSAAWRVPPRVLFRARAKAEMEGTTISEVITEALKAYGDAPPGSRVTYRMPGSGRKG